MARSASLMSIFEIKSWVKDKCGWLFVDFQMRTNILRVAFFLSDCSTQLLCSMTADRIGSVQFGSVWLDILATARWLCGPKAPGRIRASIKNQIKLQSVWFTSSSLSFSLWFSSTAFFSPLFSIWALIELGRLLTPSDSGSRMCHIF